MSATDPDSHPANAVNLIASIFGHCYLYHYDAKAKTGMWRPWFGLGKHRQPYNQKPSIMFVVQVTYEGKSYVLGVRTEKDARRLAAWLTDEGKCKKVRVFQGDITWSEV